MAGPLAPAARPPVPRAPPCRPAPPAPAPAPPGWPARPPRRRPPNPTPPPAYKTGGGERSTHHPFGAPLAQQSAPHIGGRSAGAWGQLAALLRQLSGSTPRPAQGPVGRNSRCAVCGGAPAAARPRTAARRAPPRPGCAPPRAPACVRTRGDGVVSTRWLTGCVQGRPRHGRAPARRTCTCCHRRSSRRSTMARLVPCSSLRACSATLHHQPPTTAAGRTTTPWGRGSGAGPHARPPPAGLRAAASCCASPLVAQGLQLRHLALRPQVGLQRRLSVQQLVLQVGQLRCGAARAWMVVHAERAPITRRRDGWQYELIL